MQCPLTPAIWQRYQDTGDSQVANHLASCAACRAEAEQLASLQRSLATLPAQDVPETVAARMQRLAAETATSALTCTDVSAILERWLEGELAPAQAFLVEDHLLWCETCAAEAAKAETLLVALRALPQVTAPAAIAERLAQARVPWWQRFFPAPAPVWGRQLGLATSMAAGLALAMVSTLLLPQVATTPTSVPQVAVQPAQPPADAPDIALPAAPREAAPPIVAQQPPRRTGRTPGTSKPTATVAHDKTGARSVTTVENPKDLQPLNGQPGHNPAAHETVAHDPEAANGDGGVKPVYAARVVEHSAQPMLARMIEKYERSSEWTRTDNSHPVDLDSPVSRPGI